MNTMNDSVKDTWKTYGRWVFLISLAFFPTYPLCNWITSQRTHLLGIYFDAELGIPFVPQFIWAYLSMYILFLTPPLFLNVEQLQSLGKQLLIGTLLSSLAFLIIPSHLGFTRVIPNDSFYQSVFSGLFVVDQPHNMVPSLHIVFSSLILFALARATKNLGVKIVWAGWLILIMASTLLVHQHHLTDIFTGLLMATAIHFEINKIVATYIYASRNIEIR